jgi:CheY-like chemotaxis protein
MTIADDRTFRAELKKNRDFPKVLRRGAEKRETMFAPLADSPVRLDPFTPRPIATASARADTILIVEDEDHIAALLTCVLERANFHVIRARHGAECARLLEENEDEIALVMLDCTLPDVDGRVLFRELRHLRPHLPVLFVSGRDLSTWQTTIGGEGRTGFMAKPFFPAAVVRQVREMIRATV